MSWDLWQRQRRSAGDSLTPPMLRRRRTMMNPSMSSAASIATADGMTTDAENRFAIRIGEMTGVGTRELPPASTAARSGANITADRNDTDTRLMPASLTVRGGTVTRHADRLRSLPGPDAFSRCPPKLRPQCRDEPTDICRPQSGPGRPRR